MYDDLLQSRTSSSRQEHSGPGRSGGPADGRNARPEVFQITVRTRPQGRPPLPWSMPTDCTRRSLGAPQAYFGNVGWTACGIRAAAQERVGWTGSYESVAFPSGGLFRPTIQCTGPRDVSMTTIFRARRILTMNPSRPEATHVALRDGRILGAGSLDELEGWGPYSLDDRFADKVLMPGFVEGHSHASEGAMWRFVYCGYFDRMDPGGKVWPGARSVEAVVTRLQEANAKLDAPDKALSGWGLDPIYYNNQRMTRGDLDRVSTTRPIGIIHASGHILQVNSKALELAGLLRTGVNHPGVPLGNDGLPTGELKGPDAMTPVSPLVGLDRGLMATDEWGLRQFARLCVRTGVTTATDLANLLEDEAVGMMLRVAAEDTYPLRLVSLRVFRNTTVAGLIEHAVRLKKRSIDRLRLGIVKIVADGSIQGFSARLKWPGYYNGAPNGLWYVPPEHLREAYRLALEAGVQIHTHTNGDEATELVLDCVEEALRKSPTPDHRFTLQHCQLADAAQYRRMRNLGMCVNLFPNHHFHWGDQHYTLTVGPERAERMNPCATALANGVPLAIHSDAPVTPLGPLFTAWCAVNRRTASGRVLGEAERISVADALRTITLGAAYTLKLDGEIGSIETGKRADFAVLEDDPTDIGADRLKDVRVWGTVQAGRVFPASEA
ncbi:MAG: amidohydrolase [Hyphomicrobiaceae bacterium]|nr:amidohydrolase [Hyphomicrobiaceae bacterium]